MTPERERERVAYVAWRERQFSGARFMDYTDRRMFAAFRAGIDWGIEWQRYLDGQRDEPSEQSA